LPGNLALDARLWSRSCKPVRPDVISAAVATLLTLVTGSPLHGTPSAGRGSVARVSPLVPAAMRYGRSLGSPTDGRLIGGTHVDETAYLRILPAYVAGDVRWGVEPLVAMLDRAARSVRRQFPETITSVGHLSREGGGGIDRHRSHESGRDADVGFFVCTASGKQVFETNYVAFRGDATAPTWPGAFFDDARNWAFVSALLEDSEARVTHIFVASPLRARLLAYAERLGAPEPLRLRAAELMHQPRGSLPHDDHFHVRIACPERMEGCVENPGARPPVTSRGIGGARGGSRSAPLVDSGRSRRQPPPFPHFTVPGRYVPNAVDEVTPAAPGSDRPPSAPFPPLPVDVQTGVDDVDG
jgi:penicillin-insensitive murein endopeptidase